MDGAPLERSPVTMCRVACVFFKLFARRTRYSSITGVQQHGNCAWPVSSVYFTDTNVPFKISAATSNEACATMTIFEDMSFRGPSATNWDCRNRQWRSYSNLYKTPPEARTGETALCKFAHPVPAKWFQGSCPNQSLTLEAPNALWMLLSQIAP